MFLKSTGGIITGTNCYIRGHDDMKFRQKDFKEKLFGDAEFASAFNEVAKEDLEKLLATPNSTESMQFHQNVIDSILGAN